MEPKPTVVLMDRENDSYEDMMMVASPNGRCYLFHRQTGRISWYVETGEKFIHLANRGDDVDDYLGLKSQNTNAIDWSDNNTNLYHFKPNNIPKLISLDTKEKIQQYLNHHYKDSNTMVNKTKQVYHFNHAGDNTDDTSPGVAFKIEREDFYLQSSPDWSLRFARIRAWFPGFSDQERHQPRCVVYHAWDSSKFIQVCKKYNLHPLPIDNTLNKLMMNLKNNLKISLPKNDQIVAQGKHKTVILEGSYDGVDAIVKRVRTDDDSEATELQQKLRSTFYHENVVAFLGWETDGDFNYYAFEKCGVTLAEYVKSSPPYVEMSDAAMKIMCGLVDGVKHLHTKGLAHMNLNPHNILVDGDTVKICGMWNSKPLSEVGDGVGCDIHNLGHVILYLISDGKHNVPDVEDVATFTYTYPTMSYMNNLKSTLNVANEEAWYLLEHLGFLGQTQLRLNRPIISTAQLKMQPHFWSIPE